MNIKDINKDYAEGFTCDTDVYFDADTLYIDIDNRSSVIVENVEEGTACNLADYLLKKWDFSHMLKFENEQEVYNYLKS